MANSGYVDAALAAAAEFIHSAADEERREAKAAPAERCTRVLIQTFVISLGLRTKRGRKTALSPSEKCNIKCTRRGHISFG